MTFAVTATRDSTWVATRALEHIIRASVDNPPSPEDMLTALDQLDALAANLSLRGIISIADLDMVPSGIADELGRRLAVQLKTTFGVDISPDQDTLGPPGPIELNLRRMDAIAAQSFGPAKVSFW
jgi:hypothetical protein